MNIINNWYVTGDTHGDLSRFYTLQREMEQKNDIAAVIILGDAGINFYREFDNRLKSIYCFHKFKNLYFYCVRGNHDQRPEDLITIQSVYDEEVDGEVWIEERFPNIRYFKDGGTYNIKNHSVVVMGGAYSIDKDYRLMKEEVTLKRYWIPNEQLSAEEMEAIESKIKGQHFDLVLTHTCPVSWEPTDLFLSFIDQNKVDKTMEKWFDKIKDEISFNKWLFGHFHDDRKINDKAAMLFKYIYNLEEFF